MKTQKLKIPLVVIVFISALEFKARAHELCFGGRLGCFSNDPPFDVFTHWPQKPADVGTTMTIFTPVGRRVSQNMRDLVITEMDTKLPLKVLVHGFRGSERDGWLLKIKDALQRKMKCNVIIVGWEKGAKSDLSDPWGSYNQAAANTRLVGRQIRIMLENVQSQGQDLKKVHIIGHSLGAHIAGRAGAELQGLGRISGLDPAGPSFRGTDRAVRLDINDANFVDVIHTDELLGLSDAVGDVDFYPNGGNNQPGCPINRNHLNISARGTFISCDHSRAHEFYLGSLESIGCEFLAYRCPFGWDDFLKGRCNSCGRPAPGCTEMGFYADDYDARGPMYLKTTATPPFCKNG